MIVTAGKVNVSVSFYVVQDASATSPGEPVTGLLFSDIETGGSASYVRQGAARVDLTLITLASASAVHADGGFILVDDTNMPGVYRCDYPDAAFATGVDEVTLQFVVTAGKNAVAAPIKVMLTTVDLRDSVRGGMTALPNVNAGSAGGVATDTDANGAVRIVDGTAARELNTNAGAVALVDLVTTLSGHVAQTGDNFVRLGAPAGASVSADLVVIDDFVDALETRLTAARAANLDEITAVRLATLTDWIDGGRLDLLLDAIPTTAMRGTDSAALASVVGALTDAAAADEVTTADTLMQYLKQLINILIGTPGIATFKAEAAPANAVSLSEVIRAIHADVTGLAGSTMVGTDSAALASVCTEGRLAELDAANLPLTTDDTLTDTAVIGALGAGLTDITDRLPAALTKGTADSGTLSTMVDAALTEADTNYWAGDWIRFTSGTINGQTRLITGFTPASDTITFVPDTTQAVGTNSYEIIPAGATGVDWGQVLRATTVVDLSATDIQLVDTTTINTDMRGTDGVDTAAMRGTDSAALASVATEARLAELDAANLPTTTDGIQTDLDNATDGLGALKTLVDGVKTETALIVTDTNELQVDWVNGGRLDLILDTLALEATVAALNDVSTANLATALTDIHLDHLLAVDYDPASKPGVATALFNELIESNAGVSRLTAAALTQAWAVATRVLTANTNLNDPTLAAIIAGIWDELTATARTAGSYGQLFKDDIDAVLSTLALASVCTEPRLSEMDAGTAGKAANQIDLIKTEADKLVLVDAGAGVAGSVIEEVENRAIPGDAMTLSTDAVDAAALATDGVDEIRDGIMPTQNAAFNNIEFLFVHSTDHVTPVTGATGISVTRSIDGGAFAAATGTVAEVGNGIYQFDASAADMNGGVITFRFLATGGTPGAPDDRFLTVVTGGGV